MRFDCPSCGTTLTVPGAVAGLEGPCPKCWQTIISPDPGRGLPARLPAPPAPDSLPALPVAGAPQPELGGLPAATSSPPDENPPAVADAAPEADAAPQAVVRPRRRALAFVLWLLTAVSFASGGYFLGRSVRTDSWITGAPVPPRPDSPAASAALAPEPTPVPVPDATADSAPVPVITPDPSPPPAPAPPPERAAPEGALRAFLDAPDWHSRLVFVLAPEEVGPAMEKYAADHGDGPIPVQSIEFLEATPPNHIFKVCTTGIPEGFPVVVMDTDEGMMIDWESFIGFHDDLFRKFIEDPAGKSGIFDLLVRPDPDESAEGNPNFARYRLSVPMPNREAVAWIRKDSVAHARLLAIFHGSGGFDQETVDRLREIGIPLVLSLAQHGTSGDRSYLEIEDFVAIGWGPAGP